MAVLFLEDFLEVGEADDGDTTGVEDTTGPAQTIIFQKPLLYLDLVLSLWLKQVL